MKMKTLKLTQEEVSIFLSVALSGNSNFAVSTEGCDDNGKTFDSFEDKLTYYIFSGQTFDIVDVEDESNKATLSLLRLSDGFSRALNGDFGPSARGTVLEIMEGEDGDYDEGDADELLQYIIFGEVMFG